MTLNGKVVQVNPYVGILLDTHPHTWIEVNSFDVWPAVGDTISAHGRYVGEQFVASHTERETHDV